MSFLDELNDLINDDQTDNTEAIESLTLDSQDETAIVLCSIMESMGYEEGLNYVIENANSLYAYGMIDNAEVAVEAARNVVRLNKEAKFNKEKALACLRLAKQANYPGYKKYRLHRDKMLEARADIMNKFDAKGTQEARRIIQNSKRNASSMSGKAGSDLSKQMDKRMKANFNASKSKAVAD